MEYALALGTSHMMSTLSIVIMLEIRLQQTAFEILHVKCANFNSFQMRWMCAGASHLSCPKRRSYATVTL